MQTRIALLLPYFGSIPPWWSLYIESVKKNQEFDFIYVTDLDISKWSDLSNVKVINYSISKIEEIASYKLGFRVNLKSSYKLCDLRPAFGLLFDDILKPYDYWGWADGDLIFGDITSFLDQGKISKYEVLTCREKCLAGQFSIFRNVALINNICKSIPNYERILSSEQPCYCDELAFRDQIISLWKKNLLNCSFEENLADDILSECRGRKLLFLKFSEGRIYDCITLQERFLFHFQKSKNLSKFLKSIADINPKNKFYFIKDKFVILNKNQYFLQYLKTFVIDFSWILKRMIKIYIFKKNPNFI